MSVIYVFHRNSERLGFFQYKVEKLIVGTIATESNSDVNIFLKTNSVQYNKAENIRSIKTLFRPNFTLF